MPKEEKIKVLMIVLNNFKNDSRVIKEANSLQNNNYQVKVVALHEEPLKEYEQIENFEVHRIKLFTRSWPKNTVIQLIKYFEFLTKVVKNYYNVDILHCHDLNALPIGVIIKLLLNKKAKIIYDAHEYEINATPNESRYKIKIKYYIEKSLIRFTDATITVSNSIANKYVDLYKIQKPSLVLNTPAYTEVKKNDVFRKYFNLKHQQIIFLYQGGLSEGRGIRILLEAFKLIGEGGAEQTALSTKDPVIIFMGYGALEGLIREASKESNNIFFHNAVSPNILLNYTAGADFGISTIEDTCLSYKYCLPNKMFEYIMSGIPVIASNLPEMKDVIEKNFVGITIRSNTVEGLIQAIKKALELDKEKLLINMKKFKAKYNWGEQEKILLRVYKETIDVRN